jgi:hypothetical protein
MVLGIALATVAGSAWRWGPEKWERAELLYWQWRCMNYSPAADEIVYDQEPNGRSALLDGSSKYVALVENDDFNGSTTAAVTVPDCEAQFEKMMGFGGSQPPVVFMHDRAAPSGRHYLIILRGDSIPYLDIAELPLDCEALIAGNWRNNPSWASGGRSWDGPVSVPVRQRIRIYAGQADPRDPTHFTVRYVQNGKPAVVDGYVDDVQMEKDVTLPDAFIASVKLVSRRVD